MIPRRQQRVVLARQPAGVPLPSDFAVEDAAVPEPGDGEVLVRVIYLSLDPYLRSAIAGRHMGGVKLAAGDLMPGRSVAQVIRSCDPDTAAGTYLVAETGWQQYATCRAGGTRRLDPDSAPLSTALGVLGMPGLTAWAGVTELARPRPGDTFVVSAAIGGVGSAAGQLARIAGCRVVGLAGTPEKCALAVGTFGYDACVNYKDPAWRDHLAEACRDGIDAYFDNAGGEILEAVMARLNPRGRVVLCGLIGQYNTGVADTLPLASIIRARAQMLGLVVYDYESSFPRYLASAVPWVREGRLRYLEDRAEGLSAAPEAFHRLMSGRNVGKALVAVGPEDPGEA